MRKTWVAWLVLLVMAVSAIGFAEEDISRAIGDWTQDEKGNYFYVNETLNLKFSMGKWTYYMDKESLAELEGMSVNEWLKSVQTTWEEKNFIRVMMGQSKNGDNTVNIFMTRIAENDELTDERLTEFLTEDSVAIQQNWTGVQDIGVGTIDFLGKERPCMRIKRINDKEIIYTTFVPVVNNGYYANVRLDSHGSDNTRMIADKWSLIKAEEPAGEIPAEEPAKEPAEIPTEESEADATPDCKYIAHKKSKMFHIPTCETVSLIPESSREYLNESRSELVDKGYKPCQNCHP